MNNPKSGNFYMLLILVFQFISMFVLGLMMVVFGEQFHVGNQLIVNQAVSFLIPFTAYCVYVKFCGYKITDTMKLKKISIKNILLIIGMGIFVQPFMMIISSISSMFFDNQVADILLDLSGCSLVYFLFVMAVVPAVCEELTFRGVMFKYYEKTDVKKALIINGLFFGLMHTNFQQFFYAFVLGILLAVLVYYTGSIFSSMLMHFVINGSQVLLLEVSMMMEEVYDVAVEMEEIQYTFGDYIPLILLAAAFTIVFIKLLITFIRDNTPAVSKSSFTGEQKVNRISFYIVCLLYVGVTWLFT